MASLKDVKTKIGGVKKTAQITKAMNMVAAAKLRGAQKRMEDFRDYAIKFNEAMGNVAGGADGQLPLMEVREVKNVELVVVTSDRGLCGSFNANIISKVEKLIAQYQAEGKKVSLVCVGKKGNAKLRKTGLVRKSYTDLMGSFQMFNARTIIQEVAENFLQGNADEVKLLFGQFISVGVQRPGIKDILPVRAVVAEGATKKTVDYIFEPNPADIMQTLLPLSLNVLLYSSMLEVSTSENAARMTAMDNATKACKDIIQSLTLIYNKARQGSITAELMDIVGGAEALKG